MKIAVITSRATSLMNVARDIAYVAKKRGLTPVMLDYIANPHDLARMVDSAVIVMTMNPLIARSWFLLNRELNRLGVPSFIYTTVEGRLPLRHIKDWIRRDVLFVANSSYTRAKLQETGVVVLDTVLHGINLEEVDIVLKRRDAVRRIIENKLGQGIIFGVVASNHPRKGLDLFSDVVRMVREKTRDAKFYIVSTAGAKSLFEGIDGVYVDTNFGKRTRTEILAIISAFDWYIQPSLAEGFGLPVLEAMALGVPCIHLAYEPLTEFSDPKANIWVPYDRIEFFDFKEGIEYELHLYEPKEFVDSILTAVEITKKRRDEYRERKEMARKTAMNFDVMKLYPRLIDLLDEVEKAIQ